MFLHLRLSAAWCFWCGDASFGSD